jgi:vacuolar-type H+-ATPase subunit E/Vma4
MTKYSPHIDLVRPMRRSTRINQAAQLTVTGVDSYRGPYSEQVAADTISCHGCMFKSKYDVLIDSEVMLELRRGAQGGQPIFARGVVKWTQRPGECDQKGIFYTAIELKEPGNIWSVLSPPEDWLPFCGPRKPMRVYVKPTAHVVPSAAPDIMVMDVGGETKQSHNGESTLSLPSIERPLGQLIMALQRRMEEMLSEMAAAAIREETTSMRDGLREEAKGIIAEAAAHASDWIEQSLQTVKQATENSAQFAIERIELRHRELEKVSQGLSTRFIEQLRSSVEACRRDAVDRIVTRLKKQLALPLEEARKVTANLIKAKEDLEQIIGEFAPAASTTIQGSERQFEQAIRVHLGIAGTELDRACQSTVLLTLDNLRDASKQHEAEARGRLEEALDQVSEKARTALKNESAEISRQSGEALASYSCRHLEFVGNAISELVENLRKQSPQL